MFTSKRKKMSTILENVPDTYTETGYRLHMKGAAEIVLDKCTHYIDENGERRKLDDNQKQLVLAQINEFAGKSLRNILFAYKDLKNEDGAPHFRNDKEDNNVEALVEKEDFTMICFVGIKDPIRPEVPKAVQRCKKASIVVRMVTGDNMKTAMAIASECGIISEKEVENQGIEPTKRSVFEGPEFSKLVGGIKCKNCNSFNLPCRCSSKEVDEQVVDFAMFKKIAPNLRVLARSRPEDKYLLVTGLRQMGFVVAVTGDGTNDAPALKKADVGFAMGIAGTDVAKHASDIIILDDNFRSIVEACKWGRNIYQNIRRFLQFQLTVNVVALLAAFLGSCVLTESPLKPIQLLWVNLIMDSLGSLALATEEPTEELLLEKPYGRDEYIVSRKMVKHIIGMSIWQSIIVFSIIFAGEHFIPESDPKWKGENSNFIKNGRPYDWDGTPLYKID